MGLLNQNSLPAEVMRGCVFSETFENAQKVNENGGVITGALRFDAQKGAYFDGSSKILYSSKVIPSSANISIVVEFYPDYNYDAEVYQCWYDTDATHKYALVKYPPSNTGVIINYLGTTGINIIYGAYNPYWKQYKRNVLVVSATTGSTQSYLNGTLVQNDTTTAWTPVVATALSIGGYNGGSINFTGWIKSFKVYNTKLTTAEITDIQNNSTYNFMNKAVLNCPMGLAEHDATNVRTLDRSGKGNHLVFGDGSTSTTYPTKLATVGYSLDGTTDYFNGGNVGSVKSMSFLVRPSNITQSLCDFDGGTHKLTVSAGTITATGFAAPSIYVNGLLNGVMQANCLNAVTISTPTGFTGSAFTFGKEGANFYAGNIYDLMLSSIEMTNIQAFDYKTRKFNKLNQI